MNTDNPIINPPLTPEQIKNWRNVLLGMIGPYANIMSDKEVQAFKDKMQSHCDKP